MQAAWQATSPQTTAQLLTSVNTSRTHKAVNHVSHGGVAKALEQLQQNGYLRRDTTDTRSAVFHVVITPEQYMAGAMQSLSQSVLGINVAEIFPALLGRKKLGSRKSSNSGPAAGVNQSANQEPDSVEALAQAIAASQKTRLKE